MRILRRFAPERLKLYKKPKPGRDIPPVGERKEETPVSPGLVRLPECLSQEQRKKYLIAAIVLSLFLGMLLAYLFYEPGPPPLGDADDYKSLVPLCQQGNGTACAMVSLLYRYGIDRLGGEERTTPDMNSAFVYARLACTRRSPLGCFLMWYAWVGKETLILKPPEAFAALGKGCDEESQFCCYLASRFDNRTAVSQEELLDAVKGFSGGEKRQYAVDAKENQLFRRLMDDIQGK